MARYVSLGIIAVLIICLGITFYQVIAPFLMPLFLAGMTALLCQPVLRYFQNHLKGRPTLAAATTTACILTAVMLPLLLGVFLGVHQFWNLAVAGGAKLAGVSSNLTSPVSERPISETFRHLTDQTFDHLDGFFGQAPTALDRQFLVMDDEQANDPIALRKLRRAWFDAQLKEGRAQMIDAMQGLALKTVGVVGRTIGSALSGTVDRTLGLLGTLVAATIAFVVFGLALFYFLADGPDLIAAAQALIPVDNEHQNEMMQKFGSSVRAVVLATFLAAFAQGLSTAVVMKLVGFDHFFVLLIVATFSAMIPMAGTWLVWMPGVVWLCVEESWGAAIFLGLFGLIVVGMMDNMIRTWVLQSDTQLHPLLAFVSVLGGLQVMGLWGVFIGPVVACCLHALIEIFNQELQLAESVKLARDPPAPDESEPETVDEVPAREVSTLLEPGTVKDDNAPIAEDAATDNSDTSGQEGQRETTS
jgi:predicted PurR-regulated permease PerM